MVAQPKIKTIPVKQKTFLLNTEFRIVVIPKEAWDSCINIGEQLELVFYYGQNEHQPSKKRRSVSVDDIIYIGGRTFRVASTDFEELV